MRRQQRNALLIVIIVLLLTAGLVTLFVLAPWRSTTAPTAQPTPASDPSAPVPPRSGTLVVKIDNVAAAQPQTGPSSPARSAAPGGPTWNC